MKLVGFECCKKCNGTGYIDEWKNVNTVAKKDRKIVAYDNCLEKCPNCGGTGAITLDQRIEKCNL